MVLFVLCFDPILRWIDSLMSPINTFIFAYCDDLGLVCEDLVRTWAILKKVFFIVHRIAALELNVSKTQICILFLEKQAAIMDGILEIDPVVPRSAFKDYVKYLGICVGPGAHIVQWKEVIKSYLDTVAFLRSIDAGLATTISLYNVLAASKVSWIGSFVCPSDELLNLERKSLQRLTRGPWQSLTFELLTNLQTIGFPTQFQSLALNSVAGRARNGRHTLQDFDNCTDAFEHILPSDERGLAIWRPDRYDWVARSNLLQIKSAILEVEPAEFGGPEVVWKQSAITKHLRGTASSADHFPLFKRRLARFFEADVCHPWIDNIFSIYKKQGKAVKPCILSAHLFSVCNHWCTKRRFGLPASFCPFGCSDETDNIKHLLVCPCFKRAFLSSVGQNDLQISLGNILLFTGNSNSRLLTPVNIRFVLLYNYVCFRCFNCVRHGQPFGHRMIQHILKRLALHCHGMRKSIAWFRTHTITIDRAD